MSQDTLLLFLAFILLCCRVQLFCTELVQLLRCINAWCNKVFVKCTQSGYHSISLSQSLMMIRAQTITRLPFWLPCVLETGPLYPCQHLKYDTMLALKKFKYIIIFLYICFNFYSTPIITIPS